MSDWRRCTIEYRRATGIILKSGSSSLLASDFFFIIVVRLVCQHPPVAQHPAGGTGKPRAPPAASFFFLLLSHPQNVPTLFPSVLSQKKWLVRFCRGCNQGCVLRPNIVRRSLEIGQKCKRHPRASTINLEKRAFIQWMKHARNWSNVQTAPANGNRKT